MHACAAKQRQTNRNLSPGNEDMGENGDAYEDGGAAAGELSHLRGEVSRLKRQLHDAGALADKRQRAAAAESLPLFATPHALRGEADLRAGIPASGTSAR